MLIGASLIIMLILVILNLILGRDFLGAIASLNVDNEAIIDGVPTTFVVDATDVLFNIDAGNIAGALTVLTITLVALAGVFGVSVLSSGLNPEASKIIIMSIAFGGLWGLFSVLAYGLIISIEVFGGVIYVTTTIAYVVGCVQMITGSDD